MASFGKSSLEKLYTCHPVLQEICHEAIKVTDFTILVGHRGEEEQNQAFKEGKSKLKYPESKHNQTPSLAVDIAPYPIDWNDISRFNRLAGVMFAIAHSKNVKLRWGGTWGNLDAIPSTTFRDFPHFELVI